MLQYSINSEGSSTENRPSLLSKITRNHDLLEMGAHIIYTYYELDKYIENAVQFISEGLDKEHKICFVENRKIFEEVLAKLTLRGYKNADLKMISYYENHSFYLVNQQFDVEHSLKGLEKATESYLAKGATVRTWGQVPTPMQASLLSNLRLYESHADRIVSHHKMISVCTYNGLTTPAYLYNEMLKVHQYFMTDEEIKLSPLYHKEHLQIPSSKELDRLDKIDEENFMLHENNKKLQIENNKIKLKKAVIEESENFYRNLIDEFPISIVITKNDGIIYVNQTGEKKLDSHYIKGKKFTELFQKVSTTIAEELSEYKLSINENEPKHFEIKSIPIWFGGEQAVLHALIDISQQKMHEKMMVRSEKLNIAGELAAGIAHEVRNPLTAIKGFIKLLEDQAGGEYFGIINDELTRIEQISSELLMLAKPQSDKHKTVNILDLVESVKALLETQAIMKNIEIEFIQTNRKEVYIDCEETKIRQVFINIIKNAIEVMDKGKIKIRVNESKDKVQVKITDQGYGMSTEMLARLGEPFYTTKEKGTGLGLMVCFKIVENHGGSIEVNSQQGSGTTFTITLPVSSTMEH